MNISFCNQRERGLTLVELLVVLAVLAMLAVILIPALVPSHRMSHAPRIQCVNNLSQIGVAERDWSTDHNGKYPFEVSQTNGGAMEFASGPNEFKYFQVMSNELSMPGILFCPAESKHLRQWATNFATLSNSNLSYFVNLDATDETNPQSIVFGDRNITNGTAIKNGTRELTTNSPAGWTAELHNKIGNLVLSDGSIQQVSGAGLPVAIENMNVATNRLLMPILGL